MNHVDNIVYTVRDLDAAKAVHTALLGVEPHTDKPYYVGFTVDGFEIALAPQRSDEPVGPVAHIRVADLDAALIEVQKAGATLVGAPRDVGGGARIATVADPDGTVLGLVHRV
jgi:predicted enzyme related to lactoylglutathione lyase